MGSGWVRVSCGEGCVIVSREGALYSVCARVCGGSGGESPPAWLHGLPRLGSQSPFAPHWRCTPPVPVSMRG